MSANVLVQELTVSGTPVQATAFTLAGAPYFTDGIEVQNSDGFASILAEISGAAPDLDLSMEVSIDNSDWQTPLDSAGSDISAIFTAKTADTWQALNIPLTKYLRFKIDPDADTTLTLTFLQKESR